MPQKWKYLRENDIPEWIRCSPYLESLLENGSLPESGLKVPKWCLKRDTTIRCHNDAVAFLHTARYWLLPDDVIFQSSFLNFCFVTSQKTKSGHGICELEREHPSLQGLAATVAASKDKKIASAAEYGNLYLLKYLCEVLCLAVSADAGCAAIKHGHLSCLQYLLSRGLTASHEMENEAIKFNKLSCLKHLHQDEFTFSMSVICLGVIYSARDCLEYMLQKKRPMRDDSWHLSSFASACEANAQYDHPEIAKVILKYVHYAEVYEAILIGGARGGKLATIRHCIEQNIVVPGPIRLQMLSSSARGRSFDCVEYLYSVGCVGEKLTFEAAAEGGCMDCIRFLAQQGCPNSSNFCAIAAARGHYDCLLYAHDEDFHWDERTCEGAAKKSLRCLTFAHQHGCPWDTQTCISAAGAGRLDCLQYAYQNGCPWDERTCEAAARGGHLDCLRYAHENGCPWKLKNCLQYVIERGAKVRMAAAVNAARAGCLASLQLLHSKNCPWDAKVCTEAVREGAIDCLCFLHEHGCPWDEYTYKATLPSVLEYSSKTGSKFTESLEWGKRVSECAKYMQLHKCPGSHLGHREKFWWFCSNFLSASFPLRTRSTDYSM